MVVQWLRLHLSMQRVWVLIPSRGAEGLSSWLSGKESTCPSRRCDSIPGLGRSSSGENGNPLQYSCPENPMDRGAWQATVLGVTKNQSHLATEHPQQGAAETPQALWPQNQSIKQKQCCNKFNKDFLNGPHQKKSLKKSASTVACQALLPMEFSRQEYWSG